MDPTIGISSTCPDNISGVPGHLFLTLINTLFAVQCGMNNTDKYPEDYGPKLKDNDEFDFIIVGAGAAGSALANKLTENGKFSVLVLEAGGIPSITSDIPALMFSVQQSPEDWQHQTEPNEAYCQGFKDQRCKWPRGKALGGSTSMNAMLYVRGNRRDYDLWSELGNDGWDYDSVMKIYKSFENVSPDLLKENTNYGRGGLLNLVSYSSGQPFIDVMKKAGAELGYQSHEAEQNLGYFEALNIIKDGVRHNTGRAFLGQAKSRDNLFVSIQSHVLKVIIENNVAKGIEVRIRDRTLKLYSRKEIILSAGAINSPQLLMLSGIGPKQHLQSVGIQVNKDLQVGQNLQDHMLYTGFFYTTNDNIMTPRHPLHLVDELYNYFMHKKGDLSSIFVTNFLGFINTKSDSEFPNIEFHHILIPPNEQYLLLEIIKRSGFIDEVAQAQIEANKKSPITFLYPILLNPKSRGEILLKTSNPEDKPLIIPNYLSDKNGEDMQTLLEAIRYSEKIMRSKAFKDYNPKHINPNIPNCKDFKFESDEYYRCAIRNLGSTLYHPVGTCKMGPRSDKDAVVDDRLRVHGIKNLRVADASIMPTITSCNTMAPSIMIGIKAGIMILNDHMIHSEL